VGDRIVVLDAFVVTDGQGFSLACQRGSDWNPAFAQTLSRLLNSVAHQFSLRHKPFYEAEGARSEFVQLTKRMGGEGFEPPTYWV
jgi:hypothetical protein